MHEDHRDAAPLIRIERDELGILPPAQQVAEEEPLDLAIPGRGALKSVRERRGQIDLQRDLPPTDRDRLLRGRDEHLEESMETAPGELPPGILDAQERGHRAPRA